MALETDTQTSLPWLQAFKPKTLEQICGNEFNVTYLMEAMQQRRMQNCILYGPPGVGKTSTLHCLPSAFDDKTMELTVVEMNGSDERRVSDVEARLKPFFFDATHPFEIKLLLLDEVDNMTVPAQRLLAQYLERDTKQFFNLSRIVVMACNEYQKVEPILLSKLLSLPFKLPEPYEIVAHLDNILATLGLMVDPNECTKFWDLITLKAGGDLRVAINTLQACASRAGPDKILKMQDLTSVCSVPAAELVNELVSSLQSGALANALLKTREMERQGYQLLDMLQMIESRLLELYADNETIGAKICLALAQTYLTFARGNATLLQLDGCLAAIHDIIL